MFESNEVLQKLPKHLLNLIIDQPYNDYTPQDHAVWRYVMHQNVQYLSKVAHGSYLDGLKRTGISIDKIPNMYGMNRILKEIGWAAVAVDGFIPPVAFMEFQAYNVLVIAADIRPINQIEYTYPVPKEKTHKIIYSKEAIKLHQHYQSVKDIREGRKAIEELKELSSDVDKDWLLALEMFELISTSENNTELSSQIESQLLEYRKDGNLTKLIDDGLKLIEVNSITS